MCFHSLGFPFYLVVIHSLIYSFNRCLSSVQFISVAQSCPALCNPMGCSTQASLSITNLQSLLKLMSIKLVMPSNHLFLCHPLLFLPSILPSSRVFSNESVLHIRWPKYWSFSFSISPSSQYSGQIQQMSNTYHVLWHIWGTGKLNCFI